MSSIVDGRPDTGLTEFQKFCVLLVCATWGIDPENPDVVLTDAADREACCVRDNLYIESVVTYEKTVENWYEGDEHPEDISYDDWHDVDVDSLREHPGRPKGVAEDVYQCLDCQRKYTAAQAVLLPEDET
jgi:hypothetical protein